MGIFDTFSENVKEEMRREIEQLKKSEADKLPQIPETKPDNTNAIASRGIIEDPYFDNVNQHFLFRNKQSRLSNRTLKDTSIRDWLVSAIIQCRCDTLLMFARPQHKRFETGYKFEKTNKTEEVTEEDRENMRMLEDFIYHCGRTSHVPAGQEMSFGEFLKLTVRDSLSIGYIAIEKVLTRAGALHRFRPLPAESVYRINHTAPRSFVEKELQTARETYATRRNFDNDPNAKMIKNIPDVEYFKYVQMGMDQRVLEIFGDEDMIFKNFNPQNFADSMGYAYSHLELAIINVMNHLRVENWNFNIFTHGFAAKGVLHLKGTVTQQQLQSFRSQFINTISGTEHSWKTPIIAGLDDVKWVQMSGSAREMEYINFNNHLLRAICTQFQIDPIEIGLDFLTGTGAGNSATQQANNEYKINRSRERGLYPILIFFEDLINKDILPALDKELAARYKFKFIGYTDETPQTNIALLQAEMSVHSTMNDLLREAHKSKIDHPVADLPLNATFWTLADKLMTKGEQRFHFLGDVSALDKRELKYLSGDPSFLAYQQLLVTIDQSYKQAELNKQQQEAQQEQMESADGRAQEAHDAEMAQPATPDKTLKEIAKKFNASKSDHVGGKTVANPINKLGQ